MPGLIGKKIGMTSIYTSDGNIIPVTIIEAGPCQVVSIKTKRKDGYEALQLAFKTRKSKHTSKPLAGQFKKAKLKAAKILKEFRNFDDSKYKIGNEIKVDIFNEGDSVKVSSKSKGKGFQGVMRRHGFSGVGGATHGQGDRQRAPGSIGQSSYPSRVLKGTRMAGRMGYEKVTVKNLKVIKIIPDKNIIMIKGAIPGTVNSYLEINK